VIGWPNYNPGQWISFLLPSTPTSHGISESRATSPRYVARALTQQKTSAPILRVFSSEKQRVHRVVPQQRLLYCRLFTQLVLGNGSACHNMVSWRPLLNTFGLSACVCVWGGGYSYILIIWQHYSKESAPWNEVVVVILLCPVPASDMAARLVDVTVQDSNNTPTRKINLIS
jgi:hypothetical protein